LTCTRYDNGGYFRLGVLASCRPQVSSLEANLAIKGTPGKKVIAMIENVVQVKASIGRRTLPRPFARAGGEPISKNERKVKGYVLMPLDGSALAERVIPHARALAEAMGYGLKLLRVVQLPHYLDPIGAGGAAAPAMWESWAEEPARAEEYLESVIERLAESGLALCQETVEGNPAIRILEKVQEEEGIALIAMTTHGRSGLDKWIFGSVAETVLHSSPVPVLLLPKGSDEAQEVGFTPARYGTIVVPLDGSVFAEWALEWAEPVASAMGATLVLLAVAEMPFDSTLNESSAGSTPTWEAAPWEREAHLLTEYLGDLAARLRERRLEVETQVVCGEPPAEIVRASNNCEECLVVMSTHGRSGLRGSFPGSVARRVSQSATVPLLLVHVTNES
jgi:nucleotide-binding universal stress UspA family protein